MKSSPRILVLGISVALAGCVIEPVPITESELTALNETDRAAIRDMIPPLNATLTLEEAIARSIKYNLDHRTKLLEQALALGQIEVGKFDMLPKLMTTAGYDLRDKENVRNSTDSVTGATLYSNSVSSEKQHFTSSLGLSWNLLDFGVSYYNAKQYSDRALIMGERRRKVMHNLIEKVRSAFWRTLAAQKLEYQVEETIKEAERALSDSRRIENERIKSPLEALRYQRNLLENIRLLEGVARELAQARIELLGLIGVFPNTTVMLIEPQNIDLDLDKLPVEQMEELAMLNNADLREQVYNVRVAVTETRRTIAKLFPGITFGYGYHYDSDKYLVNQQWINAGVDIGFNLLNLLAAPSQMKLAEAGVKLEENRRMAVRMSVLTQLHLARFQYYDTMRQYLRAIDITAVDQRLAKLAQSQEQSQMAGTLERISANVTFILSSVRQYYAMAKKEEALNKLKVSMGVEPRAINAENLDLAEFTSRVKDFLESDHLLGTSDKKDVFLGAGDNSANSSASTNQSAGDNSSPLVNSSVPKKNANKKQQQSLPRKAKPKKIPMVQPIKKVNTTPSESAPNNPELNKPIP